MKLEKLLELYEKEKPELSIQTIKKYRAIVKLFIIDTNIDNIFITHNECTQWRNQILSRSSAGNCNNYHRHLKALFNFAKSKNLIDENIFQSLKLLKFGKLKPKIIKNTTFEKLFSLLNDDLYYSQLGFFYLAMVDVLSYTAIRRRQLIGIYWRDIDFDSAELYLSSKFSKNGQDNTIPLNAILIARLIKLKKHSGKITGKSQVFNITKFIKTYVPNEFGETTESHISGLFTRFGKKIGENISPHRFRHTFATKIANNGGNLKALSEFLTHNDVRTTMMYVGSDMNSMRKIQDML